MLKDWQDAFGYEIYDYFRGEGGYEIVEREDGFLSVSPGPRLYFSEISEWTEPEQAAMQYVRGKVLDIGCGAGRHALYLQEQGFDVTGIDNSPHAIEVCKARGLRQTQLLPVTQISPALGSFDTILMLGNNFALLGNVKRARWLLRRFSNVTSEQGKIIAQSRDPYQTSLREHLEYQEANRKRGRLSGEARIRVRYKKYATPWFDFLMVSVEELLTLLRETHWQVKDILDGSQGSYVAIIEKR